MDSYVCYNKLIRSGTWESGSLAHIPKFPQESGNIDFLANRDPWLPPDSQISRFLRESAESPIPRNPGIWPRLPDHRRNLEIWVFWQTKPLITDRFPDFQIPVGIWESGPVFQLPRIPGSLEKSRIALVVFRNGRQRPRRDGGLLSILDCSWYV